MKHTPVQDSLLLLVCIADTHGFHRKLTLPPGDILIHAGDFDGRTVEQIDEFNAWLGELPFWHKLVIAGNHDLLFDRDPKLARAHLTNGIYLQNSGVTLEGLHFWGSPVNSVLPHPKIWPSSFVVTSCDFLSLIETSCFLI